MCVVVNVDVHTSSHSCPMYISAPSWRWGKMCAVLDPVDKKGMRFSFSLWFAFVSIIYGRSTRGACIFLTLFSQVVSTLI